MTETINLGVAFETAVAEAFDGIKDSVTVAQLKDALRTGIRYVARDLEPEQKAYIETQLPEYLTDIFHPHNGSERIMDPDHFRSDAMGYLQQNFTELYDG